MYKHLKGDSTAEIVINKSKFIGNASYVKNDEEAKSYVELIRKKYSDATHNCFAYVSDTLGNALKFSDDGEPQGTAGMPILEVIRNKKLVQTVVVVTRYFGGIKLGAGGLVRAYTDCAVRAIDSAEIVVESPCVYFEITCDYNLFKPLGLLINSLENIVQLDTEYTDMVKISLVTKAELFDEVCEKVTDLSNGKAEIKCGEKGFYAFKE
ncbi:MAG: YigZ family protein [Clostridia bacterium]